MSNTTSEGETRGPRADGGRVPSWLDALVADNLLVVVTLVLGIFLLVIGRTLLGVDSWLTLVSGREIAEHGLPHTEVLTTIPAGRTWTDQQWLAQLIYYGLFRVGGLGLDLLFHALMVTAALAITMIASRARGASSRMTLAAAVVCLAVAPWSWQLRAQSIALPLFALTLALVATDKPLLERRTLLVFPTLVLWANVHGSVLLGAMLVSLAAVFALIAARTRPTRITVWRPLAYLVLPWLCVFASPYGTGLVDYYRLLLVDSPVSRYITEWQAPRPHGYFIIFFVVAAATIAIAAWQRRRLSVYDLTVLALTLAGGLRSVRAVVWFSLALAMLLPLALDGIARPGLTAPVHRRLAAVLTGSLAVLLMVVATFTLTRSEAWFEHGWSPAAAQAAVTASDAIRGRSGRAAPTATGCSGSSPRSVVGSPGTPASSSSRRPSFARSSDSTLTSRAGGCRRATIRSSCSTEARIESSRAHTFGIPASPCSSPTNGQSWRLVTCRDDGRRARS